MMPHMMTIAVNAPRLPPSLDESCALCSIERVLRMHGRSAKPAICEP